MKSERPPFPLWIFIVTDLALLGFAALIAGQAAKPLNSSAILAVVGCALAGVLVGLVPLIMFLERQKNAALDERQRELEALTRTLTSSAEQISIAAGSLHGIAELAQKNLRQAEQLPHKLQEKMAEFQVQLAQTDDAEKEELERELLALRTTESERLDAVAQRIAKVAADWTKLESTTAQHLATAQEAVSRLSLGTAAAIGKAQAAAEQALLQARVEAARHVGDAGGQAQRSLEHAQTAALAALAAKFQEATPRLAEDVSAQVLARIASSFPSLAGDALRQAVAQVSRATPAPDAEGAPRSTHDVPPAETTAPLPAPAPESTTDSAASSPRRARRARTDTPHATAAPATSAPIAMPSAAVESTADTPAPAPAAAPVAGSSKPLNGSASAAITEPPAVAPSTPQSPAAEPAVHSPVSPAAPAGGTSESTPGAVPNPSEAPAPAEAAETRPAARKKPARRSPDDDGPGLELGLDEGGFGDTSRAAEPSERVLTSDGATRLLVTAYIGIGNRLFIRGEGPGLSWERGVPLQFVSIGKWRWETNDATQAVQFKLYKNDEHECGALGRQSLDPGHQQEVTATF